MGICNWQNIPFYVEALLRVEPKRVLDVGVGFGRWGVIAHEFGDACFERRLPRDWTVRVEGVVEQTDAISDYHSQFYEQIYSGDLREVLPTLQGGWDLIIFGELLAHYPKNEAEQLLEWALDHATYVLADLRLGAEWLAAGTSPNSAAKLSERWSVLDIERFTPVQQALFRDSRGEPYSALVFSRQDPRALKAASFARNPGRLPVMSETKIVVSPGQEEVELLERFRALINERDGLQSEVSNLRHELNLIKSSRGFRILRRLHGSRYGKLAQRLAHTLLPEEGGLIRAVIHRNPRLVTVPLRRRIRRMLPQMPPRRGYTRIRPAGERNPASQGYEVWLLAINPHDSPAIDLSSLRRSAHWELRPNEHTPTGDCLFSHGDGWIDVPSGPQTQLIFLAHDWSGKVKITTGGKSQLVDLYDPWSANVYVTPGKGTERNQQPLPIPQFRQNGRGAPSLVSTARMSRAEQEWIARLSEEPKPISVIHPEWRGIRSSTLQLFDEVYEIDDKLDESRALHYARIFAEADCPAIVIQGFPLTYRHLVKALRRVAPRLPIYVVWHGNFLQSLEEYNWASFRAAEELCRSGAVAKMGFVKKGMAEIMATTGLRTGFVMNIVRQIPEEPSQPLPGGPHMGVWGLYSNWRKPPYAMLAASLLIKGSKIHASGVDDRVCEFAKLLGIQGEFGRQAIEQKRMPQVLAQMHINMYVTLSECAPMVPLESLAVGTPCLFGPNSHYFEDHEYLHSRLVVRYPDSAATIAAYAARAIEERNAIIAAYREYAPDYNARARAMLEEFLELPQLVGH